MKAQDLKNSILQLAIQGKLVEQREEEGTAKELIEKIQAEKEQLIKEKKIKKEKPLPEITEDEIPFDIPESWEWVRLADVSHNIHYGYTSSAKEKGNCKLLRITDIQNNRVEWNDVPFCDVKDKEFKAYGLNNRDIMIARTGGTIGKTYIVDSLNDKSVFASYLIRVIPVNNINEGFLKKFMESPLYWLQLKAGSMGTGQPNVNSTTLGKLLLPLPPLTEQKRIVEKIEELMPYVEKYDKAYTEVEELNKKFPEDMQKSILQYAIQGKLVEQREEEGTAEELYQKIQVEKEKLIKEGKIKKTKALPEITEDEIPFDIPESWKWVRLGELCNYGKCNSIPVTKIPNDAWILDLEDIEKDSGRVLNKKRMKDIKSSSSKHIFNEGNILYSKLRPYLNKVVIADEDGYSTSEILPLDFGMNIYNRYAQIVLMNPYFINYTVKCSYGVKMPRLGTTDGQMAVFPLPPLDEQKRIVEKIEEILPKTKQLIKKINM
ncbi:MAG: restriction endonuclease subunit S [Sebaldella sp.]|nr:restriction endonuclease subunit S [Sebaldella sp.]